MAITLQTIVDRLELKIEDINNLTPDVLFMMGTDLNQMLYREIFAEDPDRFITPVTYNVPAAASAEEISTQALPVGFRDIREDGTGFFVVNSNGNNTTMMLRLTQFGSNQPGYYISGTNVVFTGITQAITVVLRYIPVIEDMDSFSDTFCVPDEFKELLTRGMFKLYYENQEDPRLAIADQLFAQSLEQFMETVKKDSDMYQLPSPYGGAYFNWNTPIYYNNN